MALNLAEGVGGGSAVRFVRKALWGGAALLLAAAVCGALASLAGESDAVEGIADGMKLWVFALALVSFGYAVLGGCVYALDWRNQLATFNDREDRKEGETNLAGESGTEFRIIIRQSRAKMDDFSTILVAILPGHSAQDARRHRDGANRQTRRRFDARPLRTRLRRRHFRFRIRPHAN